VTRSVLVTGAGTGPSNNLMRSLVHADPSLSLLGCHSDRFLLKKSPAARNFLVPAAGVDECEADFDSALRTVIAHTAVDAVVPGNDRDARAVALMLEREPLACRSFLPALSTIDMCQDKFVLSAFLRSRGIPAPLTYELSDHATLIEAWQSLNPAGLAWCRIRRGFASRGATKVRDAEQAWSWISYWHTMREVPVEEFTLCEFLPGRDYNVQGLWQHGRLVLIKMCERLSYLNADQQPSGMASTPAVAKTVWEMPAIEACEAALKAIDPRASGVFNFDLKENAAGVACITEINAGRFAMITNIYDFTGRHNMAAAYLRLALGEDTGIDEAYDDAGEYYLVRDLDTLPGIFSADALFEGVSTLQPTAAPSAV
jgi:hypothetical protein